MQSQCSESEAGKTQSVFLSRWRSMEPDEIATLSLTLCLDLAITVPSEEGGWSWVGGV